MWRLYQTGSSRVDTFPGNAWGASFRLALKVRRCLDCVVWGCGPMDHCCTSNMASSRDVAYETCHICYCRSPATVYTYVREKCTGDVQGRHRSCQQRFKPMSKKSSNVRVHLL